MKTYSPENIRNVAIVGHGGVGKTMLVEHLLYTAGATERVGAVDSGNTQSDFDPLEVKRKISLGASVLPIEWNDVKINLIDVPGYPDFVGDLHAVARVVESMIIVCEAKADLDVGFDLAWEVADKHGLPRCIFINKLERDNADYNGLIDTLHKRYGHRIVNVQIPIGHQAAFSGVLDLLNMKVYKGEDRGAQMEAIPSGYTAEAEERRSMMMDAAAEGSDELMEKYLEGQELTPEEVEHGLLQGIKSGRVVPVLLGSAQSGIGVATLLDRMIGELPAASTRKVKTSTGEEITTDPNGPAAAFVFKTTADPYVGRINYVRVFSGTIKQDDHLMNTVHEKDERIHNVFIPRGKNQEALTSVGAGDIFGVAKLSETKTGDTLCGVKDKIKFEQIEFPDPIYRLAVKPVSKADEDKLGEAMSRILDEDPTLVFEREPEMHQDVLAGMGDIHIETALDKLRERFGVNLETTDAKVPYRETIKGSAKAQGKFKRQSGGRGQYGDCWLEIAPLSPGEGFVFENAVVGGSIPRNYIPAVEKGVREALEKGIQAGFPVQDVKVTVCDGSYHDVDSSEAAFKTAALLGFKSAADQANPVILEPIMHVEVEVTDDAVGDVVGDLNSRRGQLHGMEPSGVGVTKISADVPMASMTRYALDLRSITKGRGRFKANLSHYAEMPHPEAQKLVQAHQEAVSEASDH